MDANEMVECVVWVQIDEDGDYTVAADAADLTGQDGLTTRTVKITLRLPRPKPVEVVATLGDERADVTVKVA